MKAEIESYPDKPVPAANCDWFAWIKITRADGEAVYVQTQISGEASAMEALAWVEAMVDGLNRRRP
jgi:hypothetical protein